MKTILYYTCNTHNLIIETACRRQLQAARGDARLIAISLKPIEFGDTNIVLSLKRSPESMHRQILAGLERAESGSTIFLCESDVLYHPSHFEFEPPTRDVFYYNEHTYKVDFATGQAVFYYTKQVSGLCADRDVLLEHYRARVARIEREGKFDRRIGYEPGCHQFPRGIDQRVAARWMSAVSNVDIRHDKNLTRSRWSPDGFRDKKACAGWKLVDEIPGWGVTKGRFAEFLQDIVR